MDDYYPIAIVLAVIVAATLWVFRYNIAAWHCGLSVIEYLHVRVDELDSELRALSKRDVRGSRGSLWLYRIGFFAVAVACASNLLAAVAKDSPLALMFAIAAGFVAALNWRAARAERLKLERSANIRLVRSN